MEKEKPVEVQAELKSAIRLATALPKPRIHKDLERAKAFVASANNALKGGL